MIYFLPVFFQFENFGMKYEDIEKVINKQITKHPTVQISFKTRSAIKGIFIQTPDYQELSRKNLWRIVVERHIDSYKQTRDENLAKIFNGTEFTRLEVVS
jgi:hypothetical protein